MAGAAQQEEEPLDLRPKWETDDEDEDVTIQEKPLDLAPKWETEEEDEEEDEDEDEDEDYDESWREDEFYKEDQDGYHEMNPKEWRKYLRHLEKSRGYDMPRFRKVLFWGGIQPCNRVFTNGCIYREVTESSKFALEQHNKEKGTNYEFYEIIKVMEEPVSGTVYYITFQGEDLKRIGDIATSNDHGNINKVKVGPNGAPLVVFQAQVWYKLPDKNRVCKMEVLDFQVKDTVKEEDKS